jgi:hypothetical protein
LDGGGGGIIGGGGGEACWVVVWMLLKCRELSRLEQEHTLFFTYELIRGLTLGFLQLGQETSSMTSVDILMSLLRVESSKLRRSDVEAPT